MSRKERIENEGWTASEVEMVAKICHQANKAFCESMGDISQADWDNAPEWQKDSAVTGVLMHLKDPFSTPADSHNSWMKEKETDGWVYGDVKDPEKKEHPCMVPYGELPAEQQQKDYIFHAIVKSFYTYFSLNLEDADHGFNMIYAEHLSKDNHSNGVRANKEARKRADRLLQNIKALPGSRERSLSITKLEEGIMWLGMDLKRLGEINPYPNSKDPSNTKIDPTADDLKL